MQALDRAREQIARAEAGSGQTWWRAFLLTDLRDLVAELERAAVLEICPHEPETHAVQAIAQPRYVVLKFQANDARRCVINATL
jgi:hypothetical protein